MNTVKEKEIIEKTATEVDREATTIEEDKKILRIEEDVVIIMTEGTVIRKVIVEIDIVKMTGGLEVETTIGRTEKGIMTKCLLRQIVLRLSHLLFQITHDPSQPAEEMSTTILERIDRFRQVHKAATGLLWMHLPR
jgi:hypothetical protein